MLWAEPWFVTPCSDVGDGDGTVEEAIQSHGNTEDLTTLCVCVCVCGGGYVNSRHALLLHQLIDTFTIMISLPPP